jgi:hypothetical protein
MSTVVVEELKLGRRDMKTLRFLQAYSLHGGSSCQSNGVLDRSAEFLKEAFQNHSLRGGVLVDKHQNFICFFFDFAEDELPIHLP